MYSLDQFRQTIWAGHATVTPANVNVAEIDNGFIATNPTGVVLRTADLQSYNLGPGTFGFFDKNNNIVTSPTACCEYYIAAASIHTVDKIGKFHGGYAASYKTKLINPKYITKVYRVDACTPQQSVISIGTTPYTSTLTKTILTVDTVGAADVLRTPGTYTDVVWSTAPAGGVHAIFNITVAVGGGATVTVVYGGEDFDINDTITVADAQLGGGGGAALTFDVATIGAVVSDATCLKSFLCGETYDLRVDVKGAPVLRSHNHNVYRTLSAYTGCCSGAVPTAVDPTLVYIEWAKQIVESDYLNNYIMPVVFDYTGVAWYAPNTTVTLDGTSTAVTSGQWWTAYTASVQAAAWTSALANADEAGMRLYGAFVGTSFANCTFQVSDHFEKEPVKILASLVDKNGDPCEFEGLCVYEECPGHSGSGYGEQVLRDVILYDAYKTNFTHSDFRIREITQGTDSINLVSRTSYYTRYFIEHLVPTAPNNGMMGSDRYLYDIITLGESAHFEAFLTTWLNGCSGTCEGLIEYPCTECVVTPDVATDPGR